MLLGIMVEKGSWEMWLLFVFPLVAVVVVVVVVFAGTTFAHIVIGAVCGSSPHNAT